MRVVLLILRENSWRKSIGGAKLKRGSGKRNKKWGGQKRKCGRREERNESVCL